MRSACSPVRRQMLCLQFFQFSFRFILMKLFLLSPLGADQVWPFINKSVVHVKFCCGNTIFGIQPVYTNAIIYITVKHQLYFIGVVFGSSMTLLQPSPEFIKLFSCSTQSAEYDFFCL